MISDLSSTAQAALLLFMTPESEFSQMEQGDLKVERDDTANVPLGI